MEPVIEVQKLEKTFKSRIRESGLFSSVKSLVKPTYKTVKAIDNISFAVNKGELLAFIGPNGAGKSTTIKTITGILFPDSGEISVLGMNPHKQRKKLSYRLGAVFGQKSQLWYHLPPVDSFHLLADIYDLDTAVSKKRIAFLTDVFEIGKHLKTPVRKLSLGERIRCEIAASLIHKPEILFLDEPTIGLDVVVKQRVRKLIRRANEEDKTTIFLTSHDTGDVEKICRRAIIINDGRIIWDDSIKKMKYSFLRKKTIALRLESPLELSMTGVEILKTKNSSAKLEVDLRQVRIEDVIGTIMKHNRIQDMTISNPPLEEVITLIYAGEQ